jgi:YesN/AraC family two-component response regulator
MYKGKNRTRSQKDNIPAVFSPEFENLVNTEYTYNKQNYNHTRNVAWYAKKLKISNIHLCTTVKKVTGNTCAEIIAHMVIMDAKSQLKSSQLSIQNISDSLNFANVSFFGKYFKRYVGMSPLEYRNNG